VTGAAPSISFLLDTHTLLWLLSDPSKLEPTAVEQLRDRRHTLFVSAASAWEIATKARLGRIDADRLLSTWMSTLAALGCDELPIACSDAIAAGQLDWPHRDPFDRMLVAQSMTHGLTLATRDDVIIANAPTAVLRA